MVRAYLNVRATGGAVASSPYRGRPWRGWMLLCFFLRAEEGDIPQQGKTLLDAAFTQGYNNSYTFRAPPVKGRLLCRDYP